MPTSPEASENRPEYIFNEQLVAEITTKVNKIFPEYPHIDKRRYDDYDPEDKEKVDRGQLLSFSRSENPGTEDEQILFVIRPSGFNIVFYNTREPEQHYTKRLPGGNVRGPDDRNWYRDEIDFALETTRILINGIDHKNENFRNQPVIRFKNDEGLGLVTLGNLIDFKEALEEEEMSTSHRPKGAIAEGPRTPKNFIQLMYKNDPEGVRDLTIMRISQNETYTTFEGEQKPSKEIVKEIEEDTPQGRRLILREVYKIAAYGELLRYGDLI